MNECNKVNLRKVAMIGCGFVGSSTCFALMQSGLFAEMVLIDANKDRAVGEAMDISHGVPLARPMRIYAGDYDDIVDAAIIIITAGAAQKPDETRLDLVNRNVEIFKSIIPEIVKRECEGILLIVSNPVDILTQVALKMSGFPKNKVIGSGTVLDTSRLKSLLGEQLLVDSRSIHAFIVGEHGDSELALWSSANVSGVPISDFCHMRGYFDEDKTLNRIYEDVKNSAYEIIDRKKSTYYGVAMAVKRICEAIVRDEKSVLPVTTMMTGQYGIEDVMISIPTIVGANGAEKIVPVSINDEEKEKLYNSVNTLRSTFDSLDLSM